MTGSIALLAVARIAAGNATFTALRGDQYSPSWDPSVTLAAQLLADLPAGTAVIAADRRTAVQVFSLSNRRQKFVYEPFWDANPSSVMSALTNDSTNRAIAVVALRPRPNVRPDATKLIFDHMSSLPSWREVPFDTSGTTLHAVEIHAFQRVP